MANSKKKFPGWAIALIIIVVLVLGCVRKYTGTYNHMVALDENVSTTWAQVQNQYQRRFDLIPNLVNTVKGYASHEAETLEKIVAERAKMGGSVTINANDQEALNRFMEQEQKITSSLQRLMAVTESYPDLKANQNFLALQDELEGTENRIATERKRFNDSVQIYNSYIRRFPNNFIANMSGFEKKAYFAAGSEAQGAPKVDF